MIEWLRDEGLSFDTKLLRIMILSIKLWRVCLQMLVGNDLIFREDCVKWWGIIAAKFFNEGSFEMTVNMTVLNIKPERLHWLGSRSLNWYPRKIF